MRQIMHQITAQEEGRTVRSIALKVMKISASSFSSLKFRNAVLKNGVPVHADARLRAGDELALLFAGEAEKDAFRPSSKAPILWEDADYYIVEKPAPLPTLSSARQVGETLESRLAKAARERDGFVFRPVNRLDKGTSGLIVAAKNAHAQQLLQRRLHTDLFIREYRAVCIGKMPQREGRIDLPIGKAGEGVKRRVCPEGKPAVTDYWVEKETEGMSLVRLRLHTGRTHQIRVHLSYLGCPVAGDYLYGAAHPLLPGRFALHACFVRFLHPITGESVEAVSPLPPLLEALLSGIEKGNP